MMQNCVFIGISYNSHTLGSAMSNLTPTITFLLAIIFSQEVYSFSNCIKRYKATRHYSNMCGILVDWLVEICIM
ncbi:hypothetical protein HN51_055036 [Arachis hypogaea]